MIRSIKTSPRKVSFKLYRKYKEKVYETLLYKDCKNPFHIVSKESCPNSPSLTNEENSVIDYLFIFLLLSNLYFQNQWYKHILWPQSTTPEASCASPKTILFVQNVIGLLISGSPFYDLSFYYPPYFHSLELFGNCFLV